MKVLFVAASFPGRVMEYLVLPSLELCICSSILKKHGHSVKLIDMKIDKLTADDVQCAFPEDPPNVILIDDSPETHFTSKKTIVLLRERYGNDVKIVLRGEIATFLPYDILKRNPCLDFIVRFDDDFAFPEIVSKIERGAKDFETIKNIAFRSGEKIIVTDRESRKYKLDDLPRPDRTLYDIEKYRVRDSETIVRSSRGCPGHCLFCIKTRFAEFGTFSISRFCDEIEELQTMGFESFFFSDDTFAFSDQRVKEFADEVNKRKLKIKFTSNIRIRDINDYKIKTLKQVGAYRFFVGIETINPDSSMLLNKNLSIDEIRQRISILKKYKMEYHASFILGAPNDTEENIIATAQFVNEIKPTVVTFNMIKAYPGLPIYDNPNHYGIIMNDPYWFESDEWTRRCVIGTQLLPPQKIDGLARMLLFSFIESKRNSD